MSSSRFGRHNVELSSTGNSLFPGDGISKGAQIAYYRDIAEVRFCYKQAVECHRHRARRW